MSDNPVPGAEGRHEETEQTTAAAESVGPVLTQQGPTSQAEATGSPEPEAPDGRANVNTSGAPKAQMQSPGMFRPLPHHTDADNIGIGSWYLISCVSSRYSQGNSSKNSFDTP
jgi:hypothetical protein